MNTGKDHGQQKPFDVGTQILTEIKIMGVIS